MKKNRYISKQNEFVSKFDPMGSYTGNPYIPFIPSFEETALAEMEVEPSQDVDDL